MFRVVVYEGDGGTTTKDFSDFQTARIYADDCASETDHGPVFASVYDQTGDEIYRGRHYGWREPG